MVFFVRKRLSLQSWAVVNFETEESTLNLGEHIACVWYDDTLNKNHWYLGVVDQVDDTGLYVSFMKKTDQIGYHWLFPEEAEICLTEKSQVIARSLTVEYRCTTTIRCIISKSTFDVIQNSFEKMID